MSIAVKVNPTVTAIKEAGEIPQAIRMIKASGITKTALAKYLGVGRDTLWTWEKGYYHPPFVIARTILLLGESAERQLRQSQ